MFFYVLVSLLLSSLNKLKNQSLLKNSRFWHEMIPFITKYDVYKTWDSLAEMTAKQNVKSVI